MKPGFTIFQCNDCLTRRDLSSGKSFSFTDKHTERRTHAASLPSSERRMLLVSPHTLGSAQLYGVRAVHCPQVPTRWDLNQDPSPESNFDRHTLLSVIVISLGESWGCSGEGLFSDASNAAYQQIRLLLSVEMVHNSDAGTNSSDALLLSITQKTKLHIHCCSSDSVLTHSEKILFHSMSVVFLVKDSFIIKFKNSRLWFTCAVLSDQQFLNIQLLWFKAVINFHKILDSFCLWLVFGVSVHSRFIISAQTRTSFTKETINTEQSLSISRSLFDVLPAVHSGASGHLMSVWLWQPASVLLLLVVFMPSGYSMQSWELPRDGYQKVVMFSETPINKQN